MRRLALYACLAGLFITWPVRHSIGRVVSKTADIIIATTDPFTRWFPALWLGRMYQFAAELRWLCVDRAKWRLA